ncbi:MAG: pallilysin-related adhesin [Rectinemataceae bacterium]|nr:pallilysin-related adhesin [Rectinemataceae bacterium]
MKRFVQALFFLACIMAVGIAIFFFNRSKTESDEAALPVAERTLTLESASGVTAPKTDSGEKRVINRIAAKPEEMVLDVVDANLDMDEGDEQILTVRNRNDPEGGIAIVVADYLPARRIWIRAWEGKTPVTKPTCFTMQVMDLAGDRSLMIVCTGLDRNNRQNLVAFRRIPGSSPIAYSMACSVGGDSVEINEKDRPDSYQLGKSFANPWDIFSFTRDSGSTNRLDRLQTTWLWDRTKSRYVSGTPVRIQGAKIEKETVQKILTGSPGDFESYIRGVWYREGGGTFGENARFLDFDIKERSVTFKSSSGQEAFSWLDSNATSSGIFMVLDNESVLDLRRLAGVDLIGANTLRVRIDDERSMRIIPDNGYSGNYRRLDASASRGLLQDVTPPAESLAVPDLVGTYRSASGSKIIFSGREFVSDDKSSGQQQTGVFAFYRLGPDLVLDMTVTGKDGLPATRKLYKTLYAVSETDKGITRSLSLMPALMGMNGLYVLEERVLRYSTGYDS